jgi:hypothetical protein
MVRRVQRAGPVGGLHDDRGPAGRGDQPVAGQETRTARHAPWRHLADDGAHVDHPLDQGRVARRVRPVDASGKDHNGGTVGGESATVSGGVDPVCAAGKDDEAAVGETTRHLARHVLAVAARGSGPDERDRARHETGQVRAATHPQAVRSLETELVQAGWPTPVIGEEERAAERGEHPQLAPGVERRETRLPPGPCGVEPAAGRHGKASVLATG